MLGDEDVVRLDVAVHDTRVVDRLHGAGDLRSDVDHLGDLERLVGAVRALAQLHHDARVAVGGERRCEHRDDALVIRELAHHLALALEREPLAFVLDAGVEHLDRDAALELVLGRLVDLAEPTRAGSAGAPCSPR